MLNFKTLQQLTDTFRTNADCLNYYQSIRFEDGIFCPHCDGRKFYFLKKSFQYRCGNKDCRKSFNVLTGTVFENTKIELRTWFAAMYLITTSKKGTSSLQVANQLGISKKTSWYLLSRIRTMLGNNEPALLEGEVQVDETAIGGKDGNRHASKKKRHGDTGEAPQDKTMVGAIEKGGKVITKIVPDRKQKTLRPFVISNVKIGSTLVTDEHTGYWNLDGLYTRETVKHVEKQYVNASGFSTNAIENYWSILKRGIYGIYHQVSVKHCQLYLDEFSFRFNSREETNQVRFIQALKQSGKKLTYQKLIGK